jgi:hypothetical protein
MPPPPRLFQYADSICKYVEMFLPLIAIVTFFYNPGDCIMCEAMVLSVVYLPWSVRGCRGFPFSAWSLVIVFSMSSYIITLVVWLFVCTRHPKPQTYEIFVGLALILYECGWVVVKKMFNPDEEEDYALEEAATDDPDFRDDLEEDTTVTFVRALSPECLLSVKGDDAEDSRDSRDCPVCWESTKHEMITCSHPICLHCCEACITNARRKKQVSCPICRHTYVLQSTT